ncbi:MAG: PEP-CTERM sorting domain-containing protein [Aquabacterium sp.]
MNRVTKTLLVTCALAAAAQAHANWPTMLASNTTGFADSVFLGPPDGTFVGLGNGQVTFDFGDMVIVNRRDAVTGQNQTDFNVYKWNSGNGVGINDAIVLVSQNGIDFFEAGPQQGITQRIAGDGLTFVTRINGRDLGSLEWARYVRVQGTSNLPPGGANGFDIDALGAFELMPAPAIPEPGTWALMLAGLAWLARRHYAVRGCRIPT